MGFKNSDDNFDKSTYVGVNTRLESFKKKNPESRVITEATVVDGVLIMKCSLYKDAQATTPMATGHSFLDGEDMDEKVGEYTETVAVGRALAFAGEQIEKSIATSEEMDRFKDLKGNKEDSDEESEEKEEQESKPRGRRSAKAADDESEDEEEEAEEASTESRPRARRGFKLPNRQGKDA